MAIRTIVWGALVLLALVLPPLAIAAPELRISSTDYREKVLPPLRITQVFTIWRRALCLSIQVIGR